MRLVLPGAFQRQCIKPNGFLSMRREVMAARSTAIVTEQDDTKLCSCFFEYETPKVVTIKSVPMGILRAMLHLIVIAFVFSYQLWYSQGYQVFTQGETCVTLKIKGFSM